MHTASEPYRSGRAFETGRDGRYRVEDYPWLASYDAADYPFDDVDAPILGFEQKRDVDKLPRSTCFNCGDLLPLGNAPAKQRRCEFGEPFENCECTGCETNRLWLAREYFGTGRPRIQCGKAECVRAAAAERKRRSRAAEVHVLDEQKQAWASGPGSRHAIFPDVRKQNGGYADPTASAAIRLLDATPEMRELFFEQNSDCIPVGKPSGDRPTQFGIFDGWLRLLAGPSKTMYWAQVAPDLFPREKPMLVENWSQQDREMYCREYHT